MHKQHSNSVFDLALPDSHVEEIDTKKPIVLIYNNIKIKFLLLFFLNRTYLQLK